MSDPVDLTFRLIACESVTPATGSVFDVLEAMLAPLGFVVHRFMEGMDAVASNEGPVENLFAVRRGPAGSRHFAFAGHLDVVPRARAGPAGPLRRRSAATCSTDAARST
jgi:succinyl-diaminopimelate desuccinylase